MDSRPGYCVTTYSPARKSEIGANRLLGETGRSIIRKLPLTATWDEIQKELCDVLGETDPKERTIEGLLKYKPKDIGLGGIAADIIAKAARATDDVDMQARLGLKAFLKVVPESIGHE